MSFLQIEVDGQFVEIPIEKKSKQVDGAMDVGKSVSENVDEVMKGSKKSKVSAG